MDLVVIGLGYVGLPLAREAVKAGLSVVGFDTNTELVTNLNSGKSHIDDLTNEDIQELLSLGFQTTSDESIIKQAEVAIICVPTPLTLDGEPDLRFITSATESVARNLHQGMLVVLESTTYPGTTEELMQPILEETSGLSAVDGFCLAFSPERVDPGNLHYGIRNTPKVVGGITQHCTTRAAEFYEQFVTTVVQAKGVKEAETAKLLENTYRHINIALVNEMARFCHELGIDLWDVIRLASTKPFGFQAFYPGPGVGGHCIPIDPNYLSHQVKTKLGRPFRFVELAQEINTTMPQYVTRRIQDILNNDELPVKESHILLLGITYKNDISDQRESPAVPLAHALQALGAIVSYHDPNVAYWKHGGIDLTRVADLDKAVMESDLVVLVQNHSSYNVKDLASKAHRLFDTRGVASGPNVYRL